LGNSDFTLLYKNGDSENLSAQPTEATIPYPHLLFKTFIEKRQVKSIQEGIEQSCYSERIRVFKEKLRFDPEIMKEFFKQTIDSIIDHVKDMLVKSNRKGGVIYLEHTIPQNCFFQLLEVRPIVR
jgi:hypothetical protein